MTYDFGSFNNWGALKKVALRTRQRNSGIR